MNVQKNSTLDVLEERLKHMTSGQEKIIRKLDSMQAEVTENSRMLGEGRFIFKSIQKDLDRLEKERLKSEARQEKYQRLINMTVGGGLVIGFLLAFFKDFIAKRIGL